MGNAANGIWQDLKTTLRGRKQLNGSFITASTGAPTGKLGDGVAARTGVGVFTVTLPKKYGSCESIIVGCSAFTSGNDAKGVYNPATGIITFTYYVAGTATETTGNTISWQAVFSDRSS